MKKITIAVPDGWELRRITVQKGSYTAGEAHVTEDDGTPGQFSSAHFDPDDGDVDSMVSLGGLGMRTLSDAIKACEEHARKTSAPISLDSRRKP